MSILLYDAINQCSFFTDSDIFEDILKAIIDSEDIIFVYRTSGVIDV